MITTVALVEAVKAHALESYETDGWDILVECWDDDDISEIIGNARTVSGAIKRCRSEVRLVNDYRSDIQGA